MENQRYPADLVVLAQDFASCGWKKVLDETSREGYSAMWQAFSAAARSAMEEGCNEQARYSGYMRMPAQ